VLAERIVPGSEKAQVNRFIDLLLSVDNEKHQRDFTDALAAFETESGRRFGKRLPALDGAQLDEILTDASVNKVAPQETSGEREQNGLCALRNLKGWISGATTPRKQACESWDGPRTACSKSFPVASIRKDITKGIP
jgi:hypothetical protein